MFLVSCWESSRIKIRGKGGNSETLGDDASFGDAARATLALKLRFIDGYFGGSHKGRMNENTVRKILVFIPKKCQMVNRISPIFGF